MNKHLKTWNFPVISGLLLLLVLFLVHALDVREGVWESGDSWQMGRYLVISGLGMIVCAAGAVRRWNLTGLFAGTALAFGLLYLYVLPPLSAPDEIRHYISAYDLSNRMLGISSADEQGRVPVRYEDWFAEDSCGDYEIVLLPDKKAAVQEDGADSAKVLGQMLTEETYRRIHEYNGTYRNSGIDASSAQVEMAYSVHRPVVTTPCAYLIPSLGITLARLLKLNTLWLLWLGRMCNLLFYVGMLSYAIYRIPFGKEVLFGVGILPMSLHLAASYSYDVLLITGIAVFTAVCIDLAYEKEKVSVYDIAVLAAIMGIAGPCKMVYAVFMGLCLLIPVKKFGGWRKWFLSAVCVFSVWAAAMILINSQTVVSYAGDTENYIDWAGEAGYTMAMLIHQPVHTARMYFQTLMWQAETWHLTMIGAYLGNVDLVLDVPYLIVVFLSGCLLVLAFRKPGESIKLRKGQKVWIWLLCFICAGALMLSMFLAWTPLSSRVICGVQGRYFLPFLPVFLLTLKNDTIVLTKNPNRSILFMMCCANAYVLMRIYSIVCMRL